MADILTRREARQQAKQNRGYNRGQFQTAMGNAKDALRRNSDLRGRELRQTARRMVAGTGSFDNAFALARKNGMKVFTWNGKKYGTKMDPNWRERWGRVGSQN